MSLSGFCWNVVALKMWPCSIYGVSRPERIRSTEFRTRYHKNKGRRMPSQSLSPVVVLKFQRGLFLVFMSVYSFFFLDIYSFS